MDSREQTGLEQGMTLVEVLVAFLVATIGVFGVLSVFPQSYRMSRDSGRITELNHLTAKKIDELRALDYDDALLAAGTHPAQALDAAGGRYYPIAGWGEAYSQRWDVLAGPTDSTGTPEAQMKTIVVETTYLGRYDVSGNLLDDDRGLTVVFRTFLTE
jgi:Tfp pilus assembly protein PilV